jgi:hypothetical protein
MKAFYQNVHSTIVDEKYVDVSISFTDEDELKTGQAQKCHKSQITEKEIEDIINEQKQDKTNTLYFRKFAINKKIKKDFFQ